MIRIASDWLTNPRTQKAMSLLGDAGHQVYAVGGCVRNDLLQVPVTDIDMSTDARPEVVMELARGAGHKAIPTGIDHGTVTVVIEGEAFEITTFRADVETDGRRAVVRFSDSVQADAIRRDFTMNALYADPQGYVTDPVGGLADLADRRFVFINDAETRIREDYLRILRYFRFMAWYGDPENGFDADTLAAIAGNLDGLGDLSRERVGAEMVKLLGAKDAAPAMAVMAQTGVLTQILPGCDARKLAVFDYFSQGLGLPIDPIARLACIGLQDGQALRLTRSDQKKLALFHSLISELVSPALIACDHGACVAKQVLALRAALFDTPPAEVDLAGIATAEVSVFPLTAQDLMPQFKGPALGEALRRAKHIWIASSFKADKNTILSQLKKIDDQG